MDHHAAGGASNGADPGNGAPGGSAGSGSATPGATGSGASAASGAANATNAANAANAQHRPAAQQTAAFGPEGVAAPLVEVAASAAQHNGATAPGRLRVSLEFDFPSDVSFIERVVGIVIRQCEDFSYPSRQCALNVPVALSEALSNAILRGNGDDRRKHVRVRAQVDERELVMEVADEGMGFDFDRCMKDPTAPENLAREDGRGLYLMRRLMDRVERFSDNGNVVRLTLKRG
ncbi:MAG: ATP-binding protein [Gemmatimonadaceae bacterium]